MRRVHDGRHSREHARLEGVTLSIRTLLMVVPSLRISGGNIEAVRLARELAQTGAVQVRIVSMWKPQHEVSAADMPVTHLLARQPLASRAWLDMPRIAAAFTRLVRQHERATGESPVLLLTHFSTFPLAWLRPRLRLACFNQDMEWLFVPPGPARVLLKRVILRTSRKATVVTSNPYITQAYRERGIPPFCEASIWADGKWLTPASNARPRDLDVLMLLRGSPIKRLDLYHRCLALLRSTPWRVAVITPDTAIAEALRSTTAEVHLRPTDEEMRTLYRRSRTFLLLSDVEGFGLPPLEAMGSGCVPVCRDAGGPRCYMQGVFTDLLVPKSVTMENLIADLDVRLRNDQLPSPDTAREHFAVGLAASLASRAACVASVAKRLAELA